MFARGRDSTKRRSLFDVSHLAAWPDKAEVWPENWPAYTLFDRVRTQWRTGGMGGTVGLDYGVLYPLMDRMDLAKDEWLQMLDDIRAMESGAMQQLAENQSEG